MTFLPQAKKMNEPSAELNSSIENELYELRRSFDITFQLSNVDPDIDGMDQPMGPSFYSISSVLLDRQRITKLSVQILIILEITTTKLSISLSNLQFNLHESHFGSLAIFYQLQTR